MLLQRSHIGRFQGFKIGIADVGRFVINQAAHQTEQSFSAIQRQARQLNDIAVGESLIAADAYLHSVLAAQDGRKQRQRFDNVFVIHRFLQKEKPPEHCGSKGCGSYEWCLLPQAVTLNNRLRRGMTEHEFHFAILS